MSEKYLTLSKTSLLSNKVDDLHRFVYLYFLFCGLPSGILRQLFGCLTFLLLIYNCSLYILVINLLSIECYVSLTSANLDLWSTIKIINYKFQVSFCLVVFILTQPYKNKQPNDCEVTQQSNLIELKACRIIMWRWALQSASEAHKRNLAFCCYAKEWLERNKVLLQIDYL